MSLRMVRIWVAEGCNAFCPHCMNASERTSVEMDIDHFYSICQYFAENGMTKVSLMGGEPTTNKAFPEMYRIAQRYFPEVLLFTNGINEQALKTCYPRPSDAIVYNFYHSNVLDKERLLLGREGDRIMDIVVDGTSNICKIVNEAYRITLLGNGGVSLHLVLNNSTDIFSDRKRIAKNLTLLYDELIRIPNSRVTCQISAPYCFIYGLKLPPHQYSSICPEEAVLIDGSYNVRFCNLHSKQLINLFQNDTVIPFQILRNYVRNESAKMRTIAFEKICHKCILFQTKCNGKCHIFQDCITEDSIINNTELPWLKKIV